jgi:adenine-specific DNA-methyltransferase
MAKIEVSRTELIWPGKYDEDGFLKDVPRVTLPFQVIETVNETRASREARKAGIQQSLFDVWEGKEGDTFDEGWKNKLIWGDNLLVMGSLVEKFAGKIDLIYIDPPFATGADFSFRALVGDEEVTKDATLIEEKAYRDTWGRGLVSFTQMLFDRFQLMRYLLSETGTIFVHMGWEVSHYVKLALDGVFGSERFVNQIIWKRQTAHSDAGQGADHLGRLHDVIFMYTKGDSYTLNMQFLPYDDKYLDTHYKGRRTRDRQKI